MDFRTPPGFDRTRNAEIGNKDIKLKHLEEAFTSEHWLVRIYKVKKLENRDRLEHKLRGTDTTKQKYTSKKVSSELDCVLSITGTGLESYSVGKQVLRPSSCVCFMVSNQFK